MKLSTFLLSLCVLVATGFSGSAIGNGTVIEVGDNVPEFCWSGIDDNKVCLPNYANTVRVLIYGTGWCPDCNREMQELVPRVGEFHAKPVTFISLSSQGDVQGAPPTKEFLVAWRDRHKIPFIVAASPRDAGKNFFAPPIYIPNVVVIGRDNRLAYKAIEPKIEDLLAEIRKTLGE